MIAKLVPVEVDRKRQDTGFCKRYHAYRRMRDGETRPDDPSKPDHVVELQMKRGDPFATEYRYEIASGTGMISWFTASTIKPGSPGYETNKHIMWFGGSVHPDHRRSGIGRGWGSLAAGLMVRPGLTPVSARAP